MSTDLIREIDAINSQNIHPMEESLAFYQSILLLSIKHYNKDIGDRCHKLTYHIFTHILLLFSGYMSDTRIINITKPGIVQYSVESREKILNLFTGTVRNKMLEMIVLNAFYNRWCYAYIKIFL